MGTERSRTLPGVTQPGRDKTGGGGGDAVDVSQVRAPGPNSQATLR